jgi:acetylornithine/succinyldiaminopimelate/putrescine aminotransferase
MLSHRHLFLNHLAQTSATPLMLEIERAEGVYLYTTDGMRYIDLISGIAVSNVGHCHPKVVEAVKNQAEKYMHVMVYGELVQSPQVHLATRLSENLPANLNNVYFVNSGAEAVEGAMKLAKRYTRRTEILSCYDAYHGSTQGALSVGGGEYFKQAYRPLLPATRQIHFGSFSDLDTITHKVAALIIEVVQGEAGVRTAPKGYFEALREKCTQTDTLLIFDEIQTGFGRTGKLWAFEHEEVVPDVLLLAKGMGGGMPIGAFISSTEKMQVFQDNPILGHITTFGGHPVSCAASLASLEVISEGKLFEQAEAKAQLFKDLLIHPKIKTIRNKGLLMAVEFESFDVLQKLIFKAIELGVLTDWFLFNSQSMRIAPPLIISEDEIREACTILLEAME